MSTSPYDVDRTYDDDDGVTFYRTDGTFGGFNSGADDPAAVDVESNDEPYMLTLEEMAAAAAELETATKAADQRTAFDASTAAAAAAAADQRTAVDASSAAASVVGRRRLNPVEPRFGQAQALLQRLKLTFAGLL